MDLFRVSGLSGLGCTEPIAIAYAASIAAKEIEGKIEEIDITVNPGVYKNGFAVTVSRPSPESRRVPIMPRGAWKPL